MDTDFGQDQHKNYCKNLCLQKTNKAVLEKYVETTEEGRQAEEEFYNRYIDYLRKFSHLLDAICTFVFDFLEYAEKYNSNQLKSLLDRRFLKLNALKCEVLYLFGAILLLLENEFPGYTKERIFVAYYRSSAEFHSNLEMLVSLLRNRKEPFENCFIQLKVNSAFVDHVINFLKSYTTLEDSDYLHEQISNEKQAAMIYTCLYFKPDHLHNQFNVMRQIVDKYFADKWVISLHLELKVNLCDKWDGYKAASAALQNTIHSTTVARNAAEKAQTIRAYQLPSALLAVENLGDYGKLISEYNAHLRWLVLHSTPGETKQKKSLAVLNLVNSNTKLSSKDLVSFLTKLAYFEYKFRQSCLHLITRKREDCSRLKSKVCSIFDQIIVFLDNPVSMQTSINWNEKLKNWLQTIKKCVAKISEVSELHTGELIILNQYFSMVSNQLNRLMNICLVDNAFLERLNSRTDCIYLLQFLDQSTTHLEELLKEEALSVKHIFLKLSASIANLIGSFIEDQGKCDILSTFYHKRLEIRLKKIIQAIPRAIFSGMDELQNLFSPIYTIQIQKQMVKQFADLDRRRLLAQKTSEITKLSLGISNMCISRLGNVEIQPRELLINGLREELAQKLRRILTLCQENILRTLVNQSSQLKAFRKAFLFVCEHIGVNGVAMWQAEIQAIVGSAFTSQRAEVKNKLLLSLPAIAQQTHNKKPVVIQLIDYILSSTNPRTSVYNCLKNEWRSVDGKKTEFTLDFFTAIENWFPGIGLSSLGRVISFNICSLLKSLRHEIEKASGICQSLPQNIDHKYIENLKMSSAFNELQRKLVTFYCKIGQLQTLQRSLKFSMEENLKVQMEAMLNSSKNFLRALSIEKTAMPLKNSENVAFYFANLELIKENGKQKNARNTSALLFASMVVYFSSATATKKSEHMDRSVVLWGLTTVIQRLGLWSQFCTLTQLLLNDRDIIESLKNVSLLLPVSTIPQK
uniref:WASH complex subunit strumpellin n=1 Tax=Ditylenchus dipsaci TaxID=166011 RepID=A0A915DKT2_9BILA